MDALLNFRTRQLDAEYWACEEVKRQHLFFDRLGLAISILITAAAALNDARPGIRLSAATLGTVHLAWLHLSKDSYLKRRIWAIAFQRARFLVVSVSAFYMLPTELVFKHVASSFQPGSARAFASIIAYTSLPVLVSHFNFLLPFKHALLFSAATFAFYLDAALPHQLAAIERFQLQRFVQPACEEAGAAGRGACSSSAAAYLMVYSFLVLSTVIPLNCHYWNEYSSKMAFLARRGGAEGARAHAGQQEMSLVACGVYCWGWCMVLWGLLDVVQTVQLFVAQLQLLG